MVLNEDTDGVGSMLAQSELLYHGLLESEVEVQYHHFSKRLKEVEWWYRTFQPDIVIGVGWWVDVPTLVLHPQKFDVLPVPWFLSDGWVANYHSILSHLPLVFTTCQWVKEVYARDGVETKNFEVLHVGFDPKKFKPIPKSDPRVREVRRMFGIRENEKMILTVGGDATSKGAQEMLQALGKITDTFPDWKYVCKVYDTEGSREHHRSELALIKRLGLNQEKIVYSGENFSHDFMPFLLNACDVYAAPSRIEGFGMVQVEAMACGKPVISIDAMGPKDTIIHGKTGFLARVASTVDLTEEWVTEEMGFETRSKMQFDKPKIVAYRANVDDLAKYTLQLLTDDHLREEMGRQAAEHALANFQYQNLAKRCVDIIQEKLHI